MPFPEHSTPDLLPWPIFPSMCTARVVMFTFSYYYHHLSTEYCNLIFWSSILININYMKAQVTSYWCMNLQPLLGYNMGKPNKYLCMYALYSSSFYSSCQNLSPLVTPSFSITSPNFLPSVLFMALKSNVNSALKAWMILCLGNFILHAKRRQQEFCKAFLLLLIPESQN